MPTERTLSRNLFEFLKKERGGGGVASDLSSTRNLVAHFPTHSPAIKNLIYATSQQTTHPFSSLFVPLCSLRVRKERTARVSERAPARPPIILLLYSQSASAPCVEASIRRDYRSLRLRYRASSFFSFALSSLSGFGIMCRHHR